MRSALACRLWHQFNCGEGYKRNMMDGCPVVVGDKGREPRKLLTFNLCVYNNKSSWDFFDTKTLVIPWEFYPADWCRMWIRRQKMGILLSRSTVISFKRLGMLKYRNKLLRTGWRWKRMWYRLLLTSHLVWTAQTSPYRKVMMKNGKLTRFNIKLSKIRKVDEIVRFVTHNMDDDGFQPLYDMAHGRWGSE